MLKARVVTALFLVAGFLAVLFLLPGRAAGIVFALIAALAGWEWAGLMKATGGRRILYGLLVFGLCLLFWTSSEQGFPLLWGVSVMFWLLFVPLWLRQRWSTACATVGLVVLLPTWAALVALHARGPELLLAAMALVWVADIAAYFTGRAFGRHKLAPAISPGKTWEGAVGAAAGVLVYGFVVAPFLPQLSDIGPAAFAGILLVLTAVSIFGDLFESLAKRQAEIKDSSQLLPGHGGILDRIDSQTSTLPLVALLLHVTT
jgi:phosphatidate cytidylyltransferase